MVFSKLEIQLRIAIGSRLVCGALLKVESQIHFQRTKLDVKINIAPRLEQRADNVFFGSYCTKLKLWYERERRFISDSQEGRCVLQN